MKLLFATHNDNKVLEVRSLLPAGFEVLSLKDLNFFDEIPETAPTIEGNAWLKANFLYERLEMPCFAEDTGLIIEALNGRPGVRSARYAGEPPNPLKNMELVLSEMKGMENRNARFKTVIVNFSREGGVAYEGICEGTILEAPRGTSGFGYDPIFQPLGCNQTFGEMRLDEKNVFSHRKKAFEKFLSGLKTS